MWNLNKWILLTILIYTHGYDRKCPHSSQWNITSRSFGCSDQKMYICLLDGLRSNDPNTVYTETCGPEDLSREGFKYILIPDLHQVPCAASQYQPFTFTTNGNSQCVLSKSLCKASGQILANNWNSSTDRSCRCDYTQNYDYVISPKDPCSCKPAEEDCSCYIRKCEDDKVMIADYRCFKKDKIPLPENIKCPEISRIITPEETDTVNKIQLLDSVVSASSTWSKEASGFILVLVFICTVLIGFLFFSVPKVTSILLTSKLELSVKRNENEFMVLNEDDVKIECNVESYLPVHSVTWQKERNDDSVQIILSNAKKEKNDDSIQITPSDERKKKDDYSIQITPSHEKDKYDVSIQITPSDEKEKYDDSIQITSSDEKERYDDSIQITLSDEKEKNDDSIKITPADEKEKYAIVSGKKPSLTINNFNAEDQGKYRCSVRNVIGMRNEIFGSCMKYMSRVGWLTRFVKVLQYIPAFYTEDTMHMTLHTYDIDPQSKPTNYSVYIGDGITMEQCYDDKRKLIAVKWYKEGDKRTALNPSDKQYSGGVLAVPALTIKKTNLKSAGRYLCILIYDKEVTETSLFKLKIIPQVYIYKAILEHREDKTFVRPAICDTIIKQMQENNIVVISGREGTGKSKICLELASFYEKKDYMIMKADLSDSYTIYADIVNAFILLIIDDEKYTQDSLNDFMKHHSQVLLKRNIKVILTCRNLDFDIVKSVLEMNKLKHNAFTDINNCLTATEKEKMLKRYMEVNNIATSASKESNFRDPKILTDFSVQVTLDGDAIKVIRNEEPWKGFPMCASLFCSKRKFLHLGEKYFTNPPRYLYEELKEIYKTARKNSNSIDIVNEYCILVYILESSNHQLDLNDPNLCRKLVEIYQTLFQFKYIPEKLGSNEDQKIAIEKAAHRMINKYLKLHEGMYKFIHPCLLKAMFLSSDYMVPYLLQNGSLHDITEFVRSEVYSAVENELVIKIDNSYHHILCERLVRHVFENRVLLKLVAKYINLYWRSPGYELVNKMFSHIEFVFYQSLGIHTDNQQHLDYESVSDHSITLENKVSFSNIIVLNDQLTCQGRDPWIYTNTAADFRILSGLVTAAIGKYATNRNQTFTVLLSEFQRRTQSESFVELWSKPLDINRNTFFHYLMLFRWEEACPILLVNEGRKILFDTENVYKYTPLDIAAYLGKVKILEVLNLKTNFTKKLKDRLQRLKRLANSGKNEFYDENRKNKTCDQSVIHKIKDEGASPGKLQCEDVGDEKEELKNKKKKRKNSLKRAFSRSKNKQIKAKKQVKNESESEFDDVLCFDVFMMNIVDFGEKEDYQSSIELLCK